MIYNSDVSVLDNKVWMELVYHWWLWSPNSDT